MSRSRGNGFFFPTFGIMSLDLLLVAFLILLNGLFAMAEIAVIAARRHVLEPRAREGDRLARAALALAEQPDRFLATVQIGITLIGVFAGAYGGLALTDDLAAVFERWGLFGSARADVAMIAVVGSITFASLVFGELVPKRLALAHATTIARLAALPMQALATAAAPAVWILSVSTRVIFRVLHVRPAADAEVTEEEIRHLIGQGAAEGAIADEERALLENVFRLGDRRIPEIMTPVAELDMIDADADADTLIRSITARPRSKYPVYAGSRDNIIGLVTARDLLCFDRNTLPPLRSILHPARFVPDTLAAHDVLTLFREADLHGLFVVDEFGTIEGLVTPSRLARELVGYGGGQHVPDVVQRLDGSWLVEASMPLLDFMEQFPAADLDKEALRDAVTIAGFVMFTLQRVPVAGERLSLGGLDIEIVDMDGARIDKLLVEMRKESGTSFTK